MKRPYREGDWFAVPLGDGSFATGLVRRDGNHVVDAVFFAADRERAVLSARVSNRALLHGRWQRIGAWRVRDANVIAPAMHSRRMMPASLAERTLARRLGVYEDDEPPYAVRELRADADAQTIDALDDGVTLAWHRPLAPGTLDAVRQWLEHRPRATLRLHGEAMMQLPSVAPWPSLRSLWLGGTPPAFTAAPSVRRLTVDAPLSTAALAASFPSLRALRVAGRGAHLDLRTLTALTSLAALDCSEVTIEHLEAIADHPALRALRLYRTRGWRTLDALTETRIETLAVEHQPQLPSLEPLARMHALEQLDLRELWQFDVHEMGWLFTLPRLHRATIDIGGRRKNVELYRRAHWAYPLPFDLVMQAVL